MRLYMKCTGTRLRKVFTGSHDRKLDYWNMGTSALVQLNFEDNCEIATATKSPERRCRDGSTDQEWRVFRQRSQRYQSLQNIPSGLLYLRCIHSRWARNYRLGTEGKALWRKEFVLGMAISTVANLVESMETGTRLLSTRWLCCTAIRRLA
jgi:hypothetical protein